MNEKVFVKLTDKGRLIYGFSPGTVGIETTFERAKVLMETGLAIDPNQKPKKERAVKQKAETAMRKK